MTGLFGMRVKESGERGLVVVVPEGLGQKQYRRKMGTVILFPEGLAKVLATGYIVRKKVTVPIFLRGAVCAPDRANSRPWRAASHRTTWQQSAAGVPRA
jgi:hypothetical protein